MDRFAEKVKLMRKNTGMSQAELAEQIGVSTRSFTDYECGRAFPRRKKLEKLADALGVTTVYLTNDSVDDPRFGVVVEQKIREAGEMFGEDAAAEMSRLIERNTAFLAGGRIPQALKDKFFEAVMDAYVTCKKESAAPKGR